jgi:hypothetical protein
LLQKAFEEKQVNISVGQHASWEADSSLDCQEILCILWNLKVDYHVHKGPTLISALNQVNPVHSVPFCI